MSSPPRKQLFRSALLLLGLFLVPAPSNATVLNDHFGDYDKWRLDLGIIAAFPDQPFARGQDVRGRMAISRRVGDLARAIRSKDYQGPLWVHAGLPVEVGELDAAGSHVLAVSAIPQVEVMSRVARTQLFVSPALGVGAYYGAGSCRGCDADVRGLEAVVRVGLTFRLFPEFGTPWFADRIVRWGFAFEPISWQGIVSHANPLRWPAVRSTMLGITASY